MKLKCRKEMIIVALMTFIMAFNIMSFDSRAANKIINLKSDVDILVSPEDGADVLVSFKKGDPVFVTGFQNGYYIVLYQGKTGYFSTATSLAQSSDVVIDENSEDADGVLDTILEEDDTFDDAGGGDVIAELDSEFKTGAEEMDYVISEIDSAEKARKSSIIWGAVIAVIIILIFALSIFGKIVERRKLEPDKEPEDECTDDVTNIEENETAEEFHADVSEENNEGSDVESESETNNKEETYSDETEVDEEDSNYDEVAEIVTEDGESEEPDEDTENRSDEDDSEDVDDTVECEFADDLEIIDLDKEEE